MSKGSDAFVMSMYRARLDKGLPPDKAKEDLIAMIESHRREMGKVAAERVQHWRDAGASDEAVSEIQGAFETERNLTTGWLEAAMNIKTTA